MGITKPASLVYRTTNLRSYNGAFNRPGSLLIWFDLEADWPAAPLSPM